MKHFILILFESSTVQNVELFLFSKNYKKFWHFKNFVVVGNGRGNKSIHSKKGVSAMDKQNRNEFEIRCAFNGYCKQVIKNEAVNTHKELNKLCKKEVLFSDISKADEDNLFTLDEYFKDSPDNEISIGEISVNEKTLSEALLSLPGDKREIILMYYFSELKDIEIAKLLNLSRSAIQYKRTKGLQLLKKYIEKSLNYG